MPRNLLAYVAPAILFCAFPVSAEAIVERLEDEGAAQRVGLLVGDQLLSWEREGGSEEIPATGAFDSAFDSREIEIEQAPLGRVTVTARRGEETLRLELPLGAWRLTTRPELDADSLAAYRESVEKLKTEAEAAANRLRELSDLAGKRGDNELATWFLYRGANHLAKAADPELAASLFSEALARADAESGSLAATVIAEELSRLLITRQGQYAEAVSILEQAKASRERAYPRSLMVPRLLTQLGVAAFRLGQVDVAEARFTEGFETAQRLAPDDPELATYIMNVGAVAQQRGDLDKAVASYRQALEIQQRLIPDSLQTARTLHNLGNVLLNRGDSAAALDYFQRSLALKERHAPASLEVAYALRALSRASSQRGDLTAAEEYAQRALEITERLAPDSPDLAMSLSQTGIVAYQRGDLLVAEDCFRRSLGIRQRLTPGSPALANSYSQLSGVAFERGDLVAAEDYSRRALEINERDAPESLGMAMALSQLGYLLEVRGDVASAKRLYARGLEIRQRQAPNGEDVAISLTELGTVAAAQGDFSAAEGYHERALELRRKLAPDSVAVAETLYMLGSVAERRGEPAAAKRYYENALEIRERHSPGSLSVATTLHSLAELALEGGDLAQASELGQRSLEIVERVAPGSRAEAKSAAVLARTQLRMGQPERSVALYRRAVDALEAQQVTFGGIESDRTVFRSNYMGIYRDLVGLLVQLGKSEEAFNLLERTRARGMLALLAERDLIFTADVSAELDRRRRLLAAEYDRTQQQLYALSVDAEVAETAALRDELHLLRRQQGELREEIKRRSPRLEALQHPDPLELKSLGRALDSGTTALSYSVAAAETLLFVTDSRGNLNVVTLAVGRAELREAVESFRQSIARSRTDGAGEEELRDLGSSLYQTLVAPAAKALEDADRVLIIPDGPLHVLPFGALVLAQPQSKSAGSTAFLVEWKPLHVAVSFTVYAELRRARSGDRREATLLAFGDPSYASGADGADAASNEALRALPRRDGTLPPLPSSRDEVAAVTALFGDAGTALLGDEATEERAKSIGTGPGLIHFATHAVVDERFPLDSAIVLSLPQRAEYGADNGVLQAWEIFESLRLDADLVTLSGCNTALGAEMAGEGIVGLTRAFHYAGSRTVLASLWSVTDSSTAVLMRGFYTYLKEGRTKDQALRAAQLDMIQGKAGPAPAATSTERGVKRLAKSKPDSGEKYTSPYYWAAFTLSGDWR